MPIDEPHGMDPDLIASLSNMIEQLGRDNGYQRIPTGNGRGGTRDWWLVRPDTPAGCLRYIVLTTTETNEEPGTVNVGVQVGIENDLLFVKRVVANAQTNTADAKALLLREWPGWVNAAETLMFADSVADTSTITGQPEDE